MTAAVVVQYCAPRLGLPHARSIRQWVDAAAHKNLAITVRIVDRREGRRLNRDFRHRDYATNVLTFTYADTKPLAGDVIVCAPVVAREARAQRKPLRAHYAHLVVHGVLHVQGFDHEADRDADQMESRERAILARLGYPDPYVPHG